jgi:hypothetical protein
MAADPSDGTAVVRLVVDEGHLEPGEHYDLRLAADLAARRGQITWLADLGGNVTSAIVPAEVAARALA